MPCDTWSPTSPTTTSTCAAPTGGWTQRGRPPWRPAYLLTTSTSSASPGEEVTVRRIAIAFMSTISALVVLFSYHTAPTRRRQRLWGRARMTASARLPPAPQLTVRRARASPRQPQAPVLQQEPPRPPPAAPPARPPRPARGRRRPQAAPWAPPGEPSRGRPPWRTA